MAQNRNPNSPLVQVLSENVRIFKGKGKDAEAAEFARQLRDALIDPKEVDKTDEEKR